MRLLSAVALTTIFSLTTYAQSMNERATDLRQSDSTTSSTKRPKRAAVRNEMMVSEGIRFVLMKPFYDNKFKVSVSDGVDSASDSNKVDGEPDFSIGAGYAYIPLRSFGFLGLLSYFETDIDDASSSDQAKIAVLEGNATYGFAPQFYGKAGLNILRIVGGNKELEKFDTNIGLQAGLGFEVAPNFGLELNYKRISAERDMNIEGLSVDAEFIQYGPEFGVHATF